MYCIGALFGSKELIKAFGLQISMIFYCALVPYRFFHYFNACLVAHLLFFCEEASSSGDKEPVTTHEQYISVQ